MGAFTKGKQLDPKRLKRDKVPAPELGDGEYVTVRAMSGKEVQQHLADRNADKPVSDAAIMALCIVDDDGNPVFTDADDLREGFDVAAETQLAVIEKILRLSGLTVDRAKN